MRERRSYRPWICLAMAVELLGCWEPNPDFMPADDSTPSETNGSSGGPFCPADGDEPNDDESHATPIEGPVLGGPLLQRTATLEAPTEEDWYTFEVSPPDGMVPNMRITAVSDTDPPDGAPALILDVCMFFECLDAPSTQVSCTAMLPTSTSPEGRVGCCRDSAERASWNCGPEVSRNARVYLSVAADVASCGEYQLEYLVSE